MTKKEFKKPRQSDEEYTGIDISMARWEGFIHGAIDRAEVDQNEFAELERRAILVYDLFYDSTKIGDEFYKALRQFEELFDKTQAPLFRPDDDDGEVLLEQSLSPQQVNEAIERAIAEMQKRLINIEKALAIKTTPTPENKND